MASFFKKKGGGGSSGHVHGTSGVQMTDSEAALAQSDFNTDKITEIQNKFGRGVVLLHPGRIFIREGLLWKVCRKGPKKRQFFLFNDILVYGSVVANRYSQQHVLPMSQMSVSAECFYQPTVDADFDEESEIMALDVANAFQISHADKSFHVFAVSAADKANWLSNLHKHISRVSQSLSSDQQLVTKPVWVPDSFCKDCMVCSIKFTAFSRKHHCRQCGRVICSPCSPYRVLSDSITGTLTSDSKKMERICKDCFQERSSQSTRHASLPAPGRPPPPNLSARTMTTSKQSATKSVAAESPRCSPGANSTDTEDSDDSCKEQETEQKNVAVMKTVQPIPAPRQKTEQNKVETLPMSATGKETEQKKVLIVEISVVETQPTAAPRQETEQKELAVMETSVVETQPTPPPRKKKLKKKLENILARDIASENVDVPEMPSEDDVKDGEDQQENMKLSDTAQEEKGSPHLDLVNKEMIPEKDISPKKSRRRRKYMCPDNPTTAEQASNSSVDGSEVQVVDYKQLSQNEVDRKDDKQAIETSSQDDASPSDGRHDSDRTTVAQNVSEDGPQASALDNGQLELEDQSHDHTNIRQDAHKKRSRKMKFQKM